MSCALWNQTAWVESLLQHFLCDLGHISEPLCALVVSSVKGEICY